MSEGIFLQEIDRVLGNIFWKYREDFKEKVAVMVSGGIDSSVVGFWVKKSFEERKFFSLVQREKAEKSFVGILGNFLGTDISFIYWQEKEKEQLRKDLTSVEKALEGKGIEKNLTQLSLGLGCFLVYEKVAQEKIGVVFSGQGPDVLLGGYHKYRKESDLNGAILKDLGKLEIDRKREEAVAGIFGLRVVYPFLEKEFVDLALRIPAELKYKNGREKFILRKYGEWLGLPEEIVNRPKKAFQYSTGIQKVVEELTKGGLVRK